MSARRAAAPLIRDTDDVCELANKPKKIRNKMKLDLSKEAAMKNKKVIQDKKKSKSPDSDNIHP